MATVNPGDSLQCSGCETVWVPVPASQWQKEPAGDGWYVVMWDGYDGGYPTRLSHCVERTGPQLRMVDCTMDLGRFLAEHPDSLWLPIPPPPGTETIPGGQPTDRRGTRP